MTTDNPAASTSPQTPPRKRRHIFRWIVLAVLAIIVIGALVVYMNLNRIVRATVEKQSTASLNQQTSLQSANVSLFGGDVSLNNFQITSPSGFQSPTMMSLGGIDVETSFGELRQDPIHISSIGITDPKMVIEMKGTSFNIKQFIDGLPPGDPKPQEGEPIKLVINSLSVNGAQVIFRPDVAALSSIPGLGDAGIKSEYVLSIPPIQMKNIGTGEGAENGAAIKEVVTLLVTELAAKAAESEQLPPEVRQLLSLNVEQITELAKQKISEEVGKQLDRVSQEISKDLPPAATQALEGILRNPQEAAKDPGKALEQGLGQILGGKKDQPPPSTQPK